MRKLFPAAVLAATFAAVTLQAQIPNGATAPPVTPVPKPSDVTPRPGAPAPTPDTFGKGTSKGSDGEAKPEAKAEAKADHVTVTGCIERADQVASAAGRDPDSLQFVLMRPAAEQSNSSASPTSKTAATDSRVLYRLIGDQQKINPHVGHKVEIVGSPVVMAANTESGASPAAGAPGLTVESVKMLDATCSNK